MQIRLIVDAKVLRVLRPLSQGQDHGADLHFKTKTRFCSRGQRHRLKYCTTVRPSSVYLFSLLRILVKLSLYRGCLCVYRWLLSCSCTCVVCSSPWYAVRETSRSCVTRVYPTSCCLVPPPLSTPKSISFIVQCSTFSNGSLPSRSRRKIYGTSYTCFYFLCVQGCKNRSVLFFFKKLDGRRREAVDEYACAWAHSPLLRMLLGEWRGSCSRRGGVCVASGIGMKKKISPEELSEGEWLLGGAWGSRHTSTSPLCAYAI